MIDGEREENSLSTFFMIALVGAEGVPCSERASDIPATVGGRPGWFSKVSKSASPARSSDWVE